MVGGRRSKKKGLFGLIKWSSGLATLLSDKMATPDSRSVPYFHLTSTITRNNLVSPLVPPCRSRPHLLRTPTWFLWSYLPLWASPAPWLVGEGFYGGRQESGVDPSQGVGVAVVVGRDHGTGRGAVQLHMKLLLIRSRVVGVGIG